MTALEIMTRAWEEAGEPTDLNPTTHLEKNIRYLNSALLRIANWQFRDGRILRIPSLVDRFYFKSQPFEETVDSVVGDDTVVVPWTGDDVTNLFVGATLTVLTGTGEGQSRLILEGSADSGDSEATFVVSEDFDPVLDNTSEIQIVWNGMILGDANVAGFSVALDPGKTLVSVLRVRDRTSNTDLQVAPKLELFTGTDGTSGIPTQYKVVGNKLLFDVSVSEPRLYEVLYLRNPVLHTDGTEAVDLPEVLHEPLVLWMVHHYHRLYQDYEKAYAVKRELEDHLSMLVIPGIRDGEMELDSLTVFG